MMEYPTNYKAKGHMSLLWGYSVLYKSGINLEWSNFRLFSLMVVLLIRIPAIIHPLNRGCWNEREGQQGPSDPFLYSQTLLIRGHFNTHTTIHFKCIIYRGTSTLIQLYTLKCILYRGTSTLIKLHTLSVFYTGTLQHSYNFACMGPLAHSYSIMYTAMNWNLMYCQEKKVPTSYIPLH